MPNYVPLTSAQKAHLRTLLAESKAAQAAAQGFLTYCCLEHGISLGRDGWEFDTEELAFVQTPSTSPFSMNPLATLFGTENGHAINDPRPD